MATPPEAVTNSNRVKVFTGNANPDLAREMCSHLKIPLGEALVDQFSDGEIRVQIHENARGCDVFVVQPTCAPVERNLMELLLMIDALKRASAERITAVLPYYGYGRQDRKDRPRVPISAKLVASLIERAGANRVLAVDLHASQIQGFFDVPVDHLFFTVPVLIDYYKTNPIERLTVVSPDAGGVERARAVAKRLAAPLAIIDKRRDMPNVAAVMHIIGRVKGRNCLIVDDLIDTAGTLVKSSEALLDHGAESVSACATHAVLSGRALDNIEESNLKEVVFSNSIPLSLRARGIPRLRTLSIGSLLARAVESIHESSSVSILFEEQPGAATHAPSNNRKTGLASRS